MWNLEDVVVWNLEDVVVWILMSAFILLLILAYIYQKVESLVIRINNKYQQRRTDYINDYVFPERLRAKLKNTYPLLSDADVLLVEQALRNYFVISTIAGKKNLAMPSQAVDLMWHEFILYTNHYQRFCRQAFNRFLHHTPTDVMETPDKAQNGIKNTWFYACYSEGINPKPTDKLPLLFALDGQLNIHDGFHYSLNCCSSTGLQYCVADIGCASESSGRTSNYDSSKSNSGREGCSSCSSCGSGCGGGD